MKKRIPLVCDNIQIAVCVAHHVHMVMRCGEDAISEYIMDADDADRLVRMLGESVDEALA